MGPPTRARPEAQPRGQQGFSLIEILLAIAIIGLLGGIAAVDYSGLLTYERLKQTARKLGGYCDRAHEAPDITPRAQAD